MFPHHSVVDLNDPTYVVASQHFRQLFQRYGSPSSLIISSPLPSTDSFSRFSSPHSEPSEGILSNESLVVLILLSLLHRNTRREGKSRSCPKSSPMPSITSDNSCPMTPAFNTPRSIWHASIARKWSRARSVHRFTSSLRKETWTRAAQTRRNGASIPTTDWLLSELPSDSE